MNFWESVKVALSGIAANKLRSLLTVLGVIIGVGAVIAMLSLGEGARVQISERIAGLGTDLLIIRPGRFGLPGAAAGARGSADVLTFEHARALVQNTSSIIRVAPEVSRTVTISAGGTNLRETVVGTTPDFTEVRRTSVAYGRFFDNEEIERASRVAVLGSGVANELFTNASPLGQMIRIDGRSFTVIGVLAERGQRGMFNTDDNIYVPLTTAQQRLFGTKYLGTIYVQARENNLVRQAEDEASALLLVELGNTELFFIQNMGEILATAEETAKTFTFLLAGIAAISLLVGGIGIMNIMLVSVTERTREIGIRKAVGASGKDILFQFIIEAVVLSATGGILGILSGVVISRLASSFSGWPVVVSMTSIVFAISLSLAVGLFFGIWPASRAAKMDPIEALRYE
ncbi:ABC transporter permease [Candidatus Aerophobetes bacterium]|nr:ABC transporter permease [Candidatus Aerophobetes bacterium]